MSQPLVASIKAALEAPEANLSFAITLMEHLVVPTFVLDAEQKVLIWNRACERLTEVRAEEVLGTSNHWQAFYEAPRPCLADLVAQANYDEIERLYHAHEDPAQPSFGVHAENWCLMPRRGQRLYLAADAGPVYDDAGKLIAVIETLRDMTEKHLAQSKVVEQAGLLKAQYDEQQREAVLARRILEHQIRSDLMKQAGVSYSVIPATNFSGDMVLAARSPAGKLYAILADATGHGLAAAVSVLPMVQEFYRLVELGQPLLSLVESINFLLTNSLPLGRFVAAAFVCLDEVEQTGEAWVGGVPDVLILDVAGKIVQRLPSRNLPLGVTRENDGIASVERFAWQQPCRLLLLSDGVIEAEDGHGVPFGEERLAEALRQSSGKDDLIETIHAVLNTHLQGSVAHDDMSVMLMDLPVQALAVE